MSEGCNSSFFQLHVLNQLSGSFFKVAGSATTVLLSTSGNLLFKQEPLLVQSKSRYYSKFYSREHHMAPKNQSIGLKTGEFSGTTII